MNKYIDSLLRFMDSSVCNFLAIDTIKKELIANGFSEKSLSEAIHCKKGDKFFVTKNTTRPYSL